MRKKGQQARIIGRNSKLCAESQRRASLPRFFPTPWRGKTASGARLSRQVVLDSAELLCLHTLLSKHSLDLKLRVLKVLQQGCRLLVQLSDLTGCLVLVSSATGLRIALENSGQQFISLFGCIS
jgi:hypothetical protein